MKLLIVESPAKCKKINSYLGNEYIVLATSGHINTLKNLRYNDKSENKGTVVLNPLVAGCTAVVDIIIFCPALV